MLILQLQSTHHRKKLAEISQMSIHSIASRAQLKHVGMTKRRIVLLDLIQLISFNRIRKQIVAWSHVERPHQLTVLLLLINEDGQSEDNEIVCWVAKGTALN